MTHHAAYVLLVDGFADWEAASAVAELKRTFGFSVKTIGLHAGEVSSMGGMRVAPDLTLAEFEPESADLLIAAGGDLWMKAEMPEITAVLRSMASRGRPIAAICAATLAVAHAGLLNDRAHTSNGRGFIEKHVPEYRGQMHYRVERAVSDRGVITANGLAPFAFAAEIFRTVAPERREDIATYEALYSRGLLDE